MPEKNSIPTGIEIAFQKLKSMNEDTTANILIGVLIIIVILTLWYLWYMSRLLDKECSKMDDLYYKINGSLRSLNASDPNCKYNFRDYYIKTAYNSCSTGSYKNNFVSTCTLKNLLRQGVRGLDFEIYSVNDSPVVATSTDDSYYIKETYNSVPFTDVMSIISNYAFSNSTSPNPDDPIILHLRFKSTNPIMYENLAMIFDHYDNLFLGPEYSYENNGKNLGTVPILNFKKKIVVIVDRSNDSFMDNKHLYEYVNMTSGSMFMRALHYYDVKNTPDIVELQDYNKQTMTISMPDKGSDPENPSAIVCRETGCQMIAMRFEKDDVNLEESNHFFNTAGYAFSLKPANLRYELKVIPDPTPQNPAVSYATRKVDGGYYELEI